MQRLIGGPKFAHRATAGHCFESLLNHTQMVEDLDIFDVSDLMLAAIEYNLRDYRHVLRELEDPETSYMKDIITYVDPATRKAALFRDALEKSVPTWFSNSQEITLSACILVTCRRGGLKRRDCLEILTRNPSIMDKLLTIVSSTRISSYLKDTSYSLAATVLCHLTKMNMSLDGNRDELDTSIKCNQLLYSQPYAVKGLVRAWNSVISESPRKIARSFTEQWKERMYPDMAWQCVQLLPHSRGMLRICILQLLSNLTLAAVAPHHLLLALLPIAYVACTRAPTELECAEAELRGDHLVDEHETEFRRVERHLVHVEHRGFERTGEEQPLKLLGPVTLFIPQETIMGPTLLFTLFRSLSTNGYTLRELRRMSKMPSDTPIIDDFPTPLDHIHQIVDKKVIGKLIRLTVHRRLGPLRESGRESLKSDPHLALEIYISAASLANAITDFALHPSNATAAGVEENMDSIRHAFQESVFATGNACEAAGRVGAWAQAKMFAELAIGLCDRYSVAEAAAIGWDLAASREKNIRRLEKSLQQLGQ
ncbi:hypothetical protein FRC02_009448 [Tulasnella sp. 418]|nr:hypothetical protein FRC02_009448 [Tulasnella sp. 418]